jgi:hypothetical protein
MPYYLGQIVHGVIISPELIDIQHKHLAYFMDKYALEIGESIEVVLVAQLKLTESQTQWIVSCQSLIYSRSLSRLLQFHQNHLPIKVTRLQWYPYGMRVQVEAMQLLIPLAHVTPKPESKSFEVKLLSISPLRLSYTASIVDKWGNETKILEVKKINQHEIKGEIEGVKSRLLMEKMMPNVKVGDRLPVTVFDFDIQQACAYVNVGKEVNLQEQK